MEQNQSNENWFALQLFTTRQQAVADYFEDKGLECFIPKQYVDGEDKYGKRKRELRPVVRNLLFLKKTVSNSELAELIKQSQYAMRVIPKSSENKEYYEISAREMHEFQIMCNPEIELRKYLSTEEARLKNGTEVDVVYGPLKGLRGKLVRQSKKYYLLKEVPGMGVMIKVSRWCCKPIIESDEQKA